jgi:hypothetical protein
MSEGLALRSGEFRHGGITGEKAIPEVIPIMRGLEWTPSDAIKQKTPDFRGFLLLLGLNWMS